MMDIVSVFPHLPGSLDFIRGAARLRLPPPASAYLRLDLLRLGLCLWGLNCKCKM